MTDRLKKEDFVRLLATRMNTDETTATARVDGVVETLYESFKDGKAGSSSSIQANDCEYFLAGHQHTQDHSSGNLSGALDMAKRTFTISSFEATIERFREIRQLALQLDQWDAVRSELLAFVQQSHKTDVEIEIALDEGQVELALELLKAGKQSKDLKKGPYGSTNFDVGIEVAKAAEENYPQEAIEIYQGYVDTHIELRDRRNYQIACQYLLSIRKLYQKLRRSNEWTLYIANRRQRNARLPALKDEMAKARL